MRLRYVIYVAVALAALSAAPSAAGASLFVCDQRCPYATIASALAAASDGDTIAVRPGRYDGGFVIDKSVTLAGAGSAKTQIVGGAPVVTVAEGVAVSIKRVSITGGGGTIGGGVVNHGSLLIAVSSVKDNSAFDPTTGLVGAGGLLNFGDATLRRSVVEGNEGAGIVNRGLDIDYPHFGSLTLIATTVAANTEDGVANQGDYEIGGGTATITRSTIADNGGWGFDSGGSATVVKSTITRNAEGGMTSGNPATIVRSRITENGGFAGFADDSRNTRATISDSVIADNTGLGVYSGGFTEIKRSTISRNGGGARVDNYNGSLFINGSSITGNSADYGGGIFVEGFGGGGATIVNSTVSGNSARYKGGGIFLQEFGAGLNIETSSLEHNRAASGGGLFVGEESIATIAESNIRANTATGGPGSGGGIFNDGGRVTLQSTLLEANIPEDCVGCG